MHPSFPRPRRLIGLPHWLQAGYEDWGKAEKGRVSRDFYYQPCCHPRNDLHSLIHCNQTPGAPSTVDHPAPSPIYISTASSWHLGQCHIIYNMGDVLVENAASQVLPHRKQIASSIPNIDALEGLGTEGSDEYNTLKKLQRHLEYVESFGWRRQQLNRLQVYPAPGRVHQG